MGHSRLSDAYAAGSAAAASAVDGRTAKIVIVFAANGYDMQALLTGVRAVAGAIALIGCSTDGEFTREGVSTNGVTVTALGGPGFRASAKVSRNATEHRRESGQHVAAAVAEVDAPYRILMLLCDGLTREQQDIVRGAYSVVGAEVPLVGGCAADMNQYDRTYQFYGDERGFEVLSDAVVGAAIGSDGPMGIGIAHGWRKIGEPAVVTRSGGGELFELDDKPALAWYLDRLGAPSSTLTDQAAFHQLAYAHPLGMSRRTGEDIRVIHDADAEKGSLTCLADIPQGALVWIMEAEEADLVGAVAEAHASAVEGLAGEPMCGLVAFDCGARYALLGTDGAAREVDELVRLVGDVPIAGFYTYGEIARIRGARGLHHLTLVLLAFA